MKLIYSPGITLILNKRVLIASCVLWKTNADATRGNRHKLMNHICLVCVTLPLKLTGIQGIILLKIS